MSVPRWLPVCVGTVFALHLVILAFTRAPLGESLGSQILQSVSVMLVCGVAALKARRSMGLARTLWLLASSGFAILFVSLIRRHFEHGEGIFVSDYMFLLYMAPFGVMLLLRERLSTESPLWMLGLDYLQLLIIAVVLFIVFIYLPSKQIPAARATRANFHFIYITFSMVLIVRNLSVTGGFWFRTLTARSKLEESIFRPMAEFLLIYTACSAVSHYLFLHTQGELQWIELQGTVPFLAGAWLFSRGGYLPARVEDKFPACREPIALHLIPATLPLMIVVFAVWIAKSAPGLAWAAVTSSSTIFALRLLVTIRSEHRANQSVREEEERYRSLAMATTQVIWTTNETGEVVMNQPMWASFSGMSRETIVGRGWLGAIHPEDRESLAEAQRSATLTKTYYDVPCRMRRHDGAYRDMAVRGVPVLSAAGRIREWIVAATDVTAQKEAEGVLRRTQDQCRHFLDQSPAGYYVAAPDGRLSNFNPAFMRMFGLISEERVKQTNLNSLCANLERRQEFFRQLKARGGVTYHEEEFRRVDGTSLYVIENAIGTFDKNGELSEIQGFLVDQTERIKSQHAFLQAQKMETMGRLAGGIAHDFNNLLCIIVGYGQELLEYAGSDREARNAAQEILHAAQRGAALTKRLLAFSRKQVLQPQVFNLNRVVEDISPMLRRVIGEHIEVQTRLDPRLESVNADPHEMEQVIVNLCVNARDAMPTGGSLMIETSNVEVNAVQTEQTLNVAPGSYVSIAVTDTGAGMDKDTLSHLFEPFFTTKAPDKGCGLGLAMVYGFVKQSGGYVWASSTRGEGSKFIVCLPRTMAEAAIHDPRTNEATDLSKARKALSLVNNARAV